MTWIKINDDLINLDNIDIIMCDEVNSGYPRPYLIKFFYSSSTDDDDYYTKAFKAKEERDKAFNRIARALDSTLEV